MRPRPVAQAAQALRILPLGPGLEMAVPAPCAHEIVEAGRILPVPGSPSWVAGVLKWRDHYIAVVDMQARVRGTRADTAAHCLVLRRPDQQGRMVFGAVLLAGLPRTAQVRPDDPSAPAPDARCWDGLALSFLAAPAGPLPVVDVEALFQPPKM